MLQCWSYYYTITFRVWRKESELWSSKGRKLKIMFFLNMLTLPLKQNSSVCPNWNFFHNLAHLLLSFYPQFFFCYSKENDALIFIVWWFLNCTVYWWSSRAALLKFSGASCVNSQLRRFLLTRFSRILEVNMWTLLLLFTFCVVVFEQLAVILKSRKFLL